MAGMLEGKIALVTGAGSGIGRASALAFARAGATVVVADVNVEAGRQVAAQIEAMSEETLFVPVDVANEIDVAELVRIIVERYGRLDCAHNNAGIEGAVAPLHLYSEESWQRVIAVNLTGTWLCMKYEIQQMLAQGRGAIVNTSSVAGLIGSKSGISAYNASKHGVVGLTKTAALEYARQGIRVNAVCPGFIETPMSDRLFTALGASHLVAQFAASMPVGRLGSAEEVAEAVVWLCSDAASYVTGVAMPVDGGYFAQ